MSHTLSSYEELKSLDKHNAYFKSKISLYIWTFFKLFHLNFTYIKNEVYEQLVYQYLTKYVPNDFRNITFQETLPPSQSTIWQFWDEDIHLAPLIVRKCIESVKNLNPTRRHVILSNDSVNDYLQLPPLILHKYKNGVITPTHFSDIIRFGLLSKYGGFWIDSTVLVTGSIDGYIRPPFFAFSSTPEYLSGNPRISLSSWFLYAHQNSIFANLVYQSLISYWTVENRYIHKYHLHYMMTHIILSHGFDFNLISSYIESNVPPHILQLSLGNKFDPDLYAHILNSSNVHKLSYYLDKNVNYIEPTFLNYILNK